MTTSTTRQRAAIILAVVFLAGVVVLASGAIGRSEAATGNDVRTDDGTVPVDTTAQVAETTTTTVPVTEPPTTTTSAPPTAVAPLPSDPAGVPLIHSVDTTDPVIFITIDDGNVADEPALQYIEQTGMPVSMFLNDPPVRTHPEYFQRLIDLGNKVHTHTRSHANLTTLGADGQRSEICGMADLLDQTYGQRGYLVRPPYGASNETTKQVSAGCGQKAVVMWMGVIDDGVVTLQKPTLEPGDIILTHFKPDLRANLEAITAMADAAGLRIARLEDYI
ncbi:polysaccharide deacetylase family protein [Rhabdothermincola salaria]|uniref:polysaccharide deacetylase family protein n=1 Tax=Rhabdothermincola salaria TaxID=2903142 RepID=UPI001E59B6DB|nr:polysaccharide deacetylase family protein [Rhabdothermincola salaria]